LAKRKKYKPESARQWRGKSYKKGGKRVRDLRAAAKKED
jgi:hypothetical protein